MIDEYWMSRMDDFLGETSNYYHPTETSANPLPYEPSTTSKPRIIGMKFLTERKDGLGYAEVIDFQEQLTLWGVKP